jgi:histidine ammonia-lyase
MGEQLMTITLNGSDLTVTQVVAAARHGETVALAPEAIAAMRRSRAIVQDVLAGGEPVYGLTTGVGERKAYLLDPAARQRFNHRLVLNHRIAQGDAAPADVARGAMLCLANSYAKGVTGVRPELAEMIVTLLNEGFAPPVRRLGSIGQGDLGPMADLAHGLITRSGFEVAENEGLALVSSSTPRSPTRSWCPPEICPESPEVSPETGPETGTAGSCRSATSTSAISPPPSTSCASRSPRW